MEPFGKTEALKAAKEVLNPPQTVQESKPEAPAKVADTEIPYSPNAPAAVPDITAATVPTPELKHSGGTLDWDTAFLILGKVKKGYESFKGKTGYNPHFFLSQIEELEKKAKNIYTREASLHAKIMALNVEDCSIEALGDRGFLQKVVIKAPPANEAPKGQ